MTRDPTRWIIIALLLVLFAGILFTWLAVVTEDRSMRAELLTDTRLATTGISATDIGKLTASDADLNSPVYRALKDSMIRIRSADPRSRFAYLMGQRDDGIVFFFVDSEPAESEDYSPPGQLYGEAGAATLAVFATGREGTSGPVSDRWGTWVSGLVPIQDPRTGRLVAVLGIDEDARGWNSRLAAAAVVPGVLSLLIMAILVISLVLQRRFARENARIQAADEAVRQSEKKYRTLIESSQDGVFIVADTRVVFHNAVVSRITGYRDEEIDGMPVSDLIAPEDREMVMRRYMERLEGKEPPARYEFRMLHRDGATRVAVRMSVSVIGYERRPAIMGTLHDISDRKRMEEALKRVGRKLGHFSTLTRNDLTNQVFLLSSYLELARHQKEPPGRTEDYLSRSEHVVRSIRALVDFIRSYQDLGEKPPSWQNVRVTLIYAMSHLNAAGVRHSIETGDLQVFADPLLERAFQYLLEPSLSPLRHVSTITVTSRESPGGLVLAYGDDGSDVPDLRDAAGSGDPEQEILRDIHAHRLLFVREILDITGISLQAGSGPGGRAGWEIHVPNGMYRFSGEKDRG